MRTASFTCTACDSPSFRWEGRCTSCGGWNTLVELPSTSAPQLPPAPLLTLLGQMGDSDPSHRNTGLAEFDRVLGGGLVEGSVTLLGGEPGVGKSTLLLQALAGVAAGGARCLMVSAEESLGQLNGRACRLSLPCHEVRVLAAQSLDSILAAALDFDAEVVAIDSIQRIADPSLDGAPGSVGQVSGCTQKLVEVAKEQGRTILLVGHVTKEGTLAGPRLLEHLVDTVLTFEGDRYHALRLLRVVKHRFGSTGEVGLFEMTEAGLVGLADPGALFLSDRRPGIPGSVVVPAIEGQRALLVEIQALVPPQEVTMPRRFATGLDSGRLAMLLAVLDGRVGISASKHDVYASVAGGARVTEPAADVAVCLALASTLEMWVVPPDVIALGEVGLGGEVRRVPHTAARLREAARLGFAKAVVPSGGPYEPGIECFPVETVAEALVAAGSPGGASRKIQRCRTA